MTAELRQPRGGNSLVNTPAVVKACNYHNWDGHNLGGLWGNCAELTIYRRQIIFLYSKDQIYFPLLSSIGSKVRFHFNKRLYHEVPDHQEVETNKKSESSPALRHQRRKGEGKLLLLHLHLVVPKHDSHVGLILSEKYEWIRGELKDR